ncbi:unnamed protein product [Miscanthus lutarioriparius]|uniref:Secreted protein n=1 Tax=Miscanthus lutarioriparius TaxID=422564 RepID=A0A811NVY3_9POAL|nr:unnamed protein product [Miscanthus lutarioriparius]
MCAAFFCIIAVVLVSMLPCSLSNLEENEEDETLCNPVNGQCDLARCAIECMEEARKRRSTSCVHASCDRRVRPQECCWTFRHRRHVMLTGDDVVVVGADP